MTTQPAISEQKRTYLDVLAILHYVHGGIMAFVVVVMVAVFAGFGGFFVVFPRRGLDWPGLALLVAVFSMVAGYALLNILVGLWLRRRRGWLATIVVSAINTLNVPLGTLLGVFTIVVLSGDEVRAVFENRSAAAPPAPRRD